MPYTIRAILSLVALGALLLAVLPVLRSSEASPQTDEGLLWCWGVAPSTLSIYPSREAPTMASPNVATILRDHVSLSTSCVDRLYLRGGMRNRKWTTVQAWLGMPRIPYPTDVSDAEWAILEALLPAAKRRVLRHWRGVSGSGRLRQCRSAPTARPRT
jgi:hypothetical protein